MALLIPTKIEQMCRTCMAFMDKTTFHSVFDYVDDKIQIFEILNQIHQLPKIEIINDELPKNICTRCVEKVCAYSEFQECCISSDLQFRKLINNTVAMINHEVERSDPLNQEIIAIEEEIKQGSTAVAPNKIDTFARVCEAPIMETASNIDLLAERVDETDKIFLDASNHDDNVTYDSECNQKIWNCIMCGNIHLCKRSLCRHKRKFHKKSDLKETNDISEDFLDAKKKTYKENNESNKTENNSQTVFVIEEEQKFGSYAEKSDKEYKLTTLLNVEMSTNKVDISKKTKVHLLINNKEKLQSNTKRTKKNVKTFECDICGVIQRSKVALKKHLKLHEPTGNSKRNKPCELCSQSFRTTKKLLEHYTTTHPERLQADDLPVPEALKYIFCPYCKKSMNHISAHLRSHTKERPFLCSHCGKGFSSNSSLKQHMLRHTDEKRYACTECPKRFTCISDLCSHRHIHKTEKPHICDICGNAFKKTHELTVHKRIHDGRKFKCEYCSKDFVCSKHLRRHLLTHSGEKPYKCKYCLRSFSQSNDMIKHLRTHVGKNVYQCELCPAVFSMAGERRIHFSTHTNDDAETRERNKRALIEAQEKLRLKFQLSNPAANQSKQDSDI